VRTRIVPWSATGVGPAYLAAICLALAAAPDRGFWQFFRFLVDVTQLFFALVSLSEPCVMAVLCYWFKYSFLVLSSRRSADDDPGSSARFSACPTRNVINIPKATDVFGNAKTLSLSLFEIRIGLVSVRYARRNAMLLLVRLATCKSSFEFVSQTTPIVSLRAMANA